MKAERSYKYGLVVLFLSASIAVTDAAMMKTEDGKTIPVTPEIGRLVNAGWTALQGGRYQQAIAHFTSALSMRPQPEVAAIIYDQRAAARLHREDVSGTLADANEAIRLDPSLASPYSKRGLVYRRHGKPKQAIAEFNLALRRNSNLAYLYNNRGLIYSDMGASDAAIRDFSEAIRRDPKYANAYHNRAVEYSKIGKNEQAIADYDEAIRRDPKVQNSHINRAFLFKQMGESRKAAADFDQVIRKSPRHTYDYVGRGDALLAKGKYKEAASDYRRALQLSPTHRDALNALAWLQATCPEASLRNGRDALQKSRKLCELTNWKNHAYIETLAAACAEVGNFDRAVQYQGQAIAMHHDAHGKRGMQKRLAVYRDRKPYRDHP